jgi:hypothetical protein
LSNALKGRQIFDIFRQVLVEARSEAHHDPFNTPKHAIEISSYEEMKHGPTREVRFVLTCSKRPPANLLILQQMLQQLLYFYRYLSKDQISSSIIFSSPEYDLLQLKALDRKMPREEHVHRAERAERLVMKSANTANGVI